MESESGRFHPWSVLWLSRVLAGRTGLRSPLSTLQESRTDVSVSPVSSGSVRVSYQNPEPPGLARFPPNRRGWFQLLVSSIRFFLPGSRSQNRSGLHLSPSALQVKLWSIHTLHRLRSSSEPQNFQWRRMISLLVLSGYFLTRFLE